MRPSEDGVMFLAWQATDLGGGSCAFDGMIPGPKGAGITSKEIATGVGG